jgi:hypothetical protein
MAPQAALRGPYKPDAGIGADALEALSVAFSPQYSR